MDIINNNKNDNNNINDNSDSDEYIDLSTCFEDNLKNIFQFHLIDEKLLIKHIGKSSDTPDIIIMENFGPNSNMSLYNCVYSNEELESIKNMDLIYENNNSKNHKIFFPIVKLIIKNNIDNYQISSIVVKLNQEIVYDSEIKDWELYLIENSSLNKEYFKEKKLDKNINPSNILENIIKLSIDSL